MVLHQFLVTNHDELIKRCRAKVEKRDSPPATDPELAYGIPLFLGQLIETLRLEKAGLSEKSRTISGPPEVGKTPTASEIGKSAASHGSELLLRGFTIEQVVHDYGDLCQAVTELATEKSEPITVEEFHTFNRCLDNATADAVTAYGKARELRLKEQGVHALNERLGELAHELGNLLTTAMLAFRAIKSGNVAVTGATGAVLDRSLIGLRDIIARSLAEVRLTAGMEVRRELIRIDDFFVELEVAASMEAGARRAVLTIKPPAERLEVDADRQMLNSAVSNLLQNAFKFTRPKGHVSLSAHAEGGRVLIDVEDECGGLSPEKAKELFRPFVQGDTDRSGVGLGLSIARRSVEANGGQVTVRNLPGKGCIFTVDLPHARNVIAL